MAKSKFKSLAATTAITLATIGVGTPAFAEEVTPTVDANTDTVVSTKETEAPKSSADVKPALDAQNQVVSDVKDQVAAAQDAATQAEQEQMTAQADVDAAKQAVKDAEVNAAKATPDNIAANQADQAANLADQQANAAETDEVNAEITDQQGKVADAQTAVDTAQASKDAADADVATKDASVKAAQDAIDGNGMAKAQDNLNKAKSDVATAKNNVDQATQAVDSAKKADANRDAKVKAAETDVKVKSDAVDTATNKVKAAQDAVQKTTDALTKANDAVAKAQDALNNADVVTIADLTQFKADKKSGDSDFMTDSGATVIEQSSTNIGNDDKNIVVNIDAITKQQQEEISQYVAQVLTEIRKKLGLNNMTVTDEAISSANKQALKYAQRGISARKAGHINGDYTGENISLWSSASSMSMYDIKRNIYESLMSQTFADAPSNWGHMQNNLKGNHIGVALVNVDGELHVIYVIQTAGGVELVNPNDPTALQAALTKAQADQAQAQTASDQANAALTQASTDYAAALDAKTKAEKVLADATATPLQTQVAENNLRLAQIALQNAQVRELEAQEAVNNFSADLATKQAKLAEAKTALNTAKADAATKATELDATKAELAKQQATLDSLNKEKAALIAEKDRLVEEAKALAEELKGYLEAPAILEQAKADLADKEATLKEAIAKAEVAHATLKEVTIKLAEEESKLAELQAEYNRLKDLEDKAKNNKIITLPDGSVIAVPKDAPTVDEKPVFDPALLVNGPKGGGVETGITVTPQGITYSRVARAKALPQTGEQESLLALFSVAVLSSLGLTGARRKRRG